MTRFLLKILSFFLFYFILFLAGLIYFVDGKSDYYYLRFTSNKQSSLILGTSVAAQGIQPRVLNDVLKGQSFELPIYNFAFTRIYSPYGKHYLECVKKKLDTNYSNGVFILSVTPWDISVKKENSSDDEELFPEKGTMITEIRNVNIKPNFEYLNKCYSKPYYKLFIKNPTYEMHEDGWSEVSPPMDSISVNKRIASKVNKFKEDDIVNYKFSENRYNSFIQTIEYLKNYGTVYIVCLPLSKEINELNQIYMPDFKNKIHQVAAVQAVDFFDYSSEDGYQTTDGYHLYKESGKEISKKIGLDIINSIKNH